MLVLGIDGSYTCTGLALVEIDEASHATVHSTDSIGTTPADGTDYQRCLAIAETCEFWAQEAGVDLVGLEVPYIDPVRSKETAMRLRELKAIIQGELERHGHTVVLVAAGALVKALGIKGRPTHDERKRAAVAAVKLRWGLDVCPDQADAIGIAITAERKQRETLARAAQSALGIKPGRRKAKRKPSTKLPPNVQEAAQRAQEAMEL